MAKRLQYDRWLLLTTLALLGLGLAMVFSASAMLSLQQFHTPYHYLIRQSIYAVLGLTALMLMLRVDYRRLSSPAVVYPVICVTIVLLAVVFALPAIAHTHRWIHAGPVTFEPSELAKLSLILFLAYILDRRGEEIRELRSLHDAWRSLRQPLAMLIPIVALVLAEPDLGTPVALILIAGAMFFTAGLRLRYFGWGCLASLPVLYWEIFHVHYRKERILAFLHPWANARGAAFQIVQSLIAIGTGGITGLGYMNSRQKLFFLPDPHTDFIFAVTSEELGLAGATLVLGLFLALLWRGLRIARKAPDTFGRYLAVGLTTMVVAQAMINMSVDLSLMPNKGIPLPLISYGGSSLFITLLGLGFLLSLSQYAE